MTVYGTWGWARAAWVEASDAKAQTGERGERGEARGQASGTAANDRGSKTDAVT